MRWNGDMREFVGWCLATEDMAAFKAGLASVPNEMWSRVELQLHELRYLPEDVLPESPGRSLGQQIRAVLAPGDHLKRARAALARSRAFQDECARRRRPS